MLGEGQLVLLYTDGLVERPGRTLAEGTVELSEAARRVPAGPSRPVERLCDAGVELLTRTTGYADDVALLAAQWRTPEPAFSASVDATLSSVPEARDAVSDWLAPLDVSAVDELAVRHAVGELVTNAVVHAHPDEPGTTHRRVEVDAELARDGVLSCSVRDDGRWQEPAPADGWGLAMVTAMVDDLRIDRGHGTSATFRLRLTRTVRMLAGRHGWDAGARRADFAVQHEGPHVEVRGDVDTASAEHLSTALVRAWCGGVQDVLVDLSGVTLLSSAAVRVLHEACRSGRTITLRAPMGSVAQHVLELVRLPYDVGAAA
jgi:anti-anti-sigma factor